MLHLSVLILLQKTNNFLKSQLRQYNMKAPNSFKFDNNFETSLPPKPFPISLSMLQTNLGSSKGGSTISPMSQLRQFKFSTTDFSSTFPNMFQYNDRYPLILSSDDEKDENEDELYKNQFHQLKHKNDFNLHSQSSKNKQNFLIKQQPQFKEIVSKEIIDNSQRPNVGVSNKIKENNKNKEKEDVNIKINKLKPQIEQIVLSKQYPIQKSSWKLPQPQTAFKQSATISTINKQLLTQSNQKQYKLLNSQYELNGEVSQFNLTNKKTEKIIQSNVSKTDEVIDYIKIIHNESQKDIQAESESNRSSHVNPKIAIKNQERQLPTQHKDIKNNNNNNTSVRQRRNKIFDSSFLKDKANRASITPQNGRRQYYQPRDRQQMHNQPQIKALSVLDKLVDQIGRVNKSNNKRHEPNKQVTRQINEFLLLLQNDLKEINRFQTIQQLLVPKIVDKHIQNRKKIRIWQQRILKQRINESTHLQSWLTPQINQFFSKLLDQFQPIDITLEKFKAAKERLTKLENKMKDMMIFMKRKELKKLYTLLGDIVGEIERMRQVKASCGKYRLQKMFQQYLSQEMLLLGEVQTQIRDNLKAK